MDLAGIRQLLVDQKEELQAEIEGQRLIKREVQEEYSKFIKSGLIKVIIGPRRSGKSVLGYRLLAGKDFAYLNFDDERLVSLDNSDLNRILQAIYEVYKKPQFIFFDEIQNINNWELFVNRLKRLGLNLLVTGSNANLLSRELSTHITGRHFALELYPFSFREYLDFKEFGWQEETFSTRDTAVIKKILETYLVSGGFPEVAQGEDYKKYLSALYSSILTKDVILRYKIRHSKTLREFASYLISNPGRYATFNKLKNIFELRSVHTAKNYFSFLQESYLVLQTERFSFKAKERLSAPRKIYSIDTGLANVLSVRFSHDSGWIYENAVAIELMRSKFLHPQRSIYYWQENNRHEVDFVIQDGIKIKQLIQVCYNLGDYDTKTRELGSLLKASLKLKCDRLLLITSDYEGRQKIKGRNIVFMPLWKWLLQQ